MSRQAVRTESQPETAPKRRVAFLQPESQLAERVAQTIGDESVASFARRSGVEESSLRAYVKRGVKPGLDHLVAICRAGNISLEWLATGQGPVHASPSAALPGTTFDDPVRLQLTIEAVQQGLEATGRTLPPAKYAELVVAAYELMAAPGATSARVVQFIKAAA